MTMTRDEIENLLDDVKAGRQVGTEDHWWHSQVCDFYLDENFGEYDDQKACDKQRILRLPALERLALSLMAQLADAKAAQALVVERAVAIGADIAERTRPDGFPEEASNAYHSGAMDVVDAIRALADPSGMEALAALRAERDGLLTTWAESRERHLKAEAERDDALARLAAAEAQVARLVGELASLDKSASEVLRLGAVTGSQWTRLNIASLKARAALKGDPT